MALQVDQCGAIANTLALRPVVNTEDLGRRINRERRTPNQVDQGRGMYRHANLPCEARTRFAAKGEGDRAQKIGEAGCGACRGSDGARQSLGKDAAGTGRSGTEELADA